MSRRLKEFAILNEVRRRAEWLAEKEYRDALFDYNDGIRKARRKYDDAMDAIEAEWQKGLSSLRE